MERKYTKEFRQEAVKLVIEGGLSIISTDEGWLYLAGHKDICTGEIVGYAMAGRITKKPALPIVIQGRAAAKRSAKGLMRQKRLEHLSPAAYEKLFYQKRIAA